MLTCFLSCVKQNLQGAREVHQFDHDVDELRGWMSEKEVVLNSEDHEHDLLGIQALIRQHDGLEVRNGPQWFAFKMKVLKRGRVAYDYLGPEAGL